MKDVTDTVYMAEIQRLNERIAELEKMVEKIKRALDIDDRNDFFEHVKMINELEKDRDNEAENCRLMQDRLQRMIDGNLKLEKRIAELDAKTEWYHEEHAKELNARVRLEATVEQMKCCGNCKYHIATMCGLNDDTEYGSNCCGNWQSDGLTKEEREAK